MADWNPVEVANPEAQSQAAPIPIAPPKKKSGPIEVANPEQDQAAVAANSEAPNPEQVNANPQAFGMVPPALASVGNAVAKYAPMTARMVGGLLGGGAAVAIGNPELAPFTAMGGAEAAGQYADSIVNRYRRAQGEQNVPTPMQQIMQAPTNMATDLVTQGVVSGTGNLVQRAARGALANPAAPAIAQDIADAGLSKEGAAPLVGNKTVKWANNFLRRMPIASDRISNAADQTLQDFGKYENTIRTGISGTTEKAAAGEAAQGSIGDFVSNTMQKAGQMYGDIKPLQTVPIPTPDMKSLAQSIVADETAGLKNPATLKIAQDVLDRGDVISFGEAQKLRSALLGVGRQSDDLVAGSAQSASKRLAAQLDSSMEDAASQLAPADFAKFRDANAFYKTQMGKLDLVDKLAKSPTGEQAFSLAFAGAKDGPTKLKAIKDVVDADTWNGLVSTKLYDMGRKIKDGPFDPVNFLNNWNGIPNSTKEVMFSGQQPELRAGYDRIARLADEFKAKSFPDNPSGTASTAATVGAITSAASSVPTAIGLMFSHHPFGAALTLGAGVGGPMAGAATLNYSGKLMTNPKFVDWLSKGLQIAPHDYNGMASQLTRLATIKWGDPATQAAVQQYVQQFQKPKPATI